MKLMRKGIHERLSANNKWMWNLNSITSIALEQKEDIS